MRGKVFFFEMAIKTTQPSVFNSPLNNLFIFLSDSDNMQTKMIRAFTIVVVCLCATQPGCWARSKHGKLQNEPNLNQVT